MRVERGVDFWEEFEGFFRENGDKFEEKLAEETE